MWDYLFDEGASILGPALMAGEPGVPAIASRPLRKRFKWFSEHVPVVETDEEPKAKPLPSIKITGRNKNDGRRAESKS